MVQVLTTCERTARCQNSCQKVIRGVLALDSSHVSPQPASARQPLTCSMTCVFGVSSRVRWRILFLTRSNSSHGPLYVVSRCCEACFVGLGSSQIKDNLSRIYRAENTQKITMIPDDHARGLKRTFEGRVSQDSH